MIETGFLQGPRPSSLDAGNPLAVDLDNPARAVLFPATHVCQQRTRDRDRLFPFLCFGLSGTPAIHQSGFGFTCLRIQFQINRILQKPKLVNAIAYGLQTEDPAPTAGFVWAIHRISRHFKSYAQDAACLALRYVKPEDWHDTHECLPGGCTPNLLVSLWRSVRPSIGRTLPTASSSSNSSLPSVHSRPAPTICIPTS